ncbi:MAG: PQQ-binding-like beta-propeller repeat protein [Tepidisphaeraceae bacterium]|jgi:outer membrane protein assembly factor BamB
MRFPAICCLAFIAAGVAAAAADCPQFGQRFTRNMASPETNLPDSFDLATGKNVAWVATLGTQSWSTPTIGSGRALVTTNNANPRDPRHQGDRGVLMCFDEKTGQFQWQLVVPKLEEDDFFDWPNVGMCSPATIEGQLAYLVTNRGEVVCLNLDGLAKGNTGPFKDEGRHMTRPVEPAMEPGPLDADIVWLYDIRNELKLHQHDSAHGSPLIDGNFLYVNTSNGVDRTHKALPTPDAPGLIVLDKRTGKLIAREDEAIGRDVIHCTWSSPSLGEVNGRRLVFFIGGNGVCYAFDAFKDAPPAGEVKLMKAVWKFDCDPTAPKENIHAYTGNRKVSASNSYGMPVFVAGRVFLVAGGDVFWGKRQSWMKCLDPAGTGDITRSGLVWQYEIPTHSLCTPAVADGLAYMTDCAKMVHCIDAATGKVVWTHKTGGEIWACPLVADGKVYVGTRKGDFWILAAGREKKILSQIDMGEPMNGSPAAANGTLYITTMSRLIALRR